MCSLPFFMISSQFDFNKNLQFTFEADTRSITGFTCTPTMFADTSSLSCFLAANAAQY
jgi:hypothetical protein